MRRLICSGVLAAVLAASLGCSGQSTPTQPALSDEQVKDAMKQGKERALKERGNRGPGGVPIK
ncbi:MAG TPA: hypothetical protein VM533_20665 [Fimbriiglobus sp.]|jgi:hypothetical protein|nr:hypothetical protein [Fimbriiglobus sp.]